MSAPAPIIIKDRCVGCSYCMLVCKSGAIRKELVDVNVIPDLCVQCLKCTRVCPMEAIILEEVEGG